MWSGSEGSDVGEIQHLPRSQGWGGVQYHQQGKEVRQEAGEVSGPAREGQVGVRLVHCL